METRHAGVVDLSNLYIGLDVLRRWRQQRLNTTEERIVKFLMSSSVLVRDSENHDLLMQELQQLLSDVSQTLTYICCDHSNVSGQIFFRGVELEVLKPEEVLVTVEGWKKAAGKVPAKAIVRDDSPEIKIKREDSYYHYVETKYSAAQNKFFRCYVLADWLAHVTHVAMPMTAISGHGLTALAAATGSSLQVLNVAGCPALDDEGIHSLVNLCTALRELNVSNCTNLSPHGILYIAEFAEKQVQNLTLVDVANEQMSPNLPRALFYALDLRGFSGTIRFSGPRGLQSHQASKRAPGSRPLLLDHCAQNSMSIFDLCGMDITSHVLSSTLDDRTKWRLDLTEQLINDALLGKYLSIWGGRLVYLSLDGTFITEKGLKELKACPNLRTLRLCACKNIINKTEANINLAPCVAVMPDIESVAVSGSRISGRMLSEHPALKLVNLEAARTPFSVHAISWLVQFCPKTLKSLSLSGCDFINLTCVKYIVHLPNLEMLDISYVMDLDIQHLVIELLDKNCELSNLRKLKIAGVHGVTPKFCEQLKDALKARFQRDVDVDGEENVLLYPMQRVQAETSPYTRLPPPELNRAQTAPEKNTYSFWHGDDLLPPSSAVIIHEGPSNIPLLPRATTDMLPHHPSPFTPLPLAGAASAAPPSLSSCSSFASSSSFSSSASCGFASFGHAHSAPVQNPQDGGGLYTTWSPTSFVDESFPWGPEAELSKVRQMNEHESYVAWDDRQSQSERKRSDSGSGHGGSAHGERRRSLQRGSLSPTANFSGFQPMERRTPSNALSSATEPKRGSLNDKRGSAHGSSIAAAVPVALMGSPKRGSENVSSPKEQQGGILAALSALKVSLSPAPSNGSSVASPPSSPERLRPATPLRAPPLFEREAKKDQGNSPLR